MRFDVLTLFPEMFSGYLGQSLLKRAIVAGLVQVHLHNIRDWAEGRHRQVDDWPYGGGPGMVLMVRPVVEAVEAVQTTGGKPAEGKTAEEGLAEGGLPPGKVVLLTPQGRRLDQQLVEELAGYKRLLLLCGRYEGFDERIRQLLDPLEVSIGDFVLNGGEVAAMTVIDAVVRLVPGVLGDEQSSQQDSFSGQRRLLEFPQYTRPPEFRGLKVPEVLLSGNHPAVAAWREEQSQKRTQERRADLLENDP